MWTPPLCDTLQWLTNTTKALCRARIYDILAKSVKWVKVVSKNCVYYFQNNLTFILKLLCVGHAINLIIYQHIYTNFQLSKRTFIQAHVIWRSHVERWNFILPCTQLTFLSFFFSLFPSSVVISYSKIMVI